MVQNMNKSELEKILKNVTESKGCSDSYTAEQIEQIREFFLMHRNDTKRFLGWNDCGLDKLLKIEYSSDSHTSFDKLEKKYGDQNFWRGGGPCVQSNYSRIRYFFRKTKPRKGQAVYDLGSGFGRVVFYGGLVTDAFIKGVEIVPARVEECNRIKENLKLENISFTQVNVLDVDFSDGDIFFMYHPFSIETGFAVLEKLRKLSEQKPILVGINHRVHGLEKNMDWLKEINRHEIYDMRIFSSKNNQEVMPK